MPPPDKLVVVLLFLTCLGALTNCQVDYAIITQPTDSFTRNGSVTTFQCVAEGPVDITYQWQKSNDTLDGMQGGAGVGYIDVENAVDSILEFNPVLFGDEGTYRCRVSSAQGDLTSDTALLTVSPEDSVQVSPLNETFNQGDEVMFTCFARGGPNNTFQWLRNGTELVGETFEMYAIPDITSTDGDEYTCTVSNAAGSESVSTFLFVSPEITLNPMDANTNDGSSAMIMCDAEAFPRPEFQWFHVDGDIGSNIMGADTNMLLFSPVQFGDEGDYFCTATSNGISVNSESSTITVSPEGSVIASPPVINAMIDTTVEFMCIAMGGPGNNFTWTRLSDGQEVSAEQRLQISVMTASDGSQYECLVENEAGSESATVVLNVAVAIDIPPVDTNVTTAEEVFLTCTASGYPLPSISWTHNDTDIDENDNRINITESDGPRFVMSTLAVSGAMINNSGEYACNATNTFSTTIGGPAIVLVQDTPEQPQNVNGMALNSTAIELNWFEPHDNNAPILGYRVRYTRPEFLDGSDVELNVTSEMAVVTGLSPGVTYNFTVIAFNEIGDSRESAVAMVATEEEEPAAPPRDVVAMAVSSTEVRVTWENVPVIDQNGDIINYEIQIEPLQFPADIFVDQLTTTNLSIVVTGLEEYIFYNISVRAYTSVGPGPYSDPVTERTLEDVPATPPQNVQATAISSTEIMVTWDEIPGLDRNGIVIDYEVQIDPLDFPADIFVDSLNTSSLSIVVTGLQEYVFYNISVRAYTSVGPGPYSDPVTERTLEDVPATPPRNVQATVISSTEIMVTWDEIPGLDQNGIITDYEVQIEPLDFPADIFVDSLNTSSLSIVVTGLQEYVFYNISVRAYTSVGPGPYSDPVTERTLEDVPATPPQNVQATAISSTEIMVTWDEIPGLDQNGIIINYEVEIEPLQFLTDIFVDQLTTTNLSIVVTGLEEYVFYNISVRAYTSVGPGPYSDPVTERTSEDVPAAPPENVQAFVISSTEILVSWSEVPELDQNGVIINYEVQLEPLDFPANISVDLVNTTSLQERSTDLEEFVSYSIIVRAYTSVGPGPYSNPVTERTSEDAPAAPPQNVQATAISSTEIMVTWDEIPGLDRNGIITDYEVQIQPLDFPADLSVNLLTTTNLSILVTDLDEYISYSIEVRAYTSVGPGPYSDPVTERTFEDVPATPSQNVQATAISSTEIMVTWDEIPELDQNGIIIEYEVQIEPLDFSADIFVDPLNTSSLSIVVTGLEEYVFYNISVRAYTSVGPGPYSDPVTERTLEDEPATPPQNVNATAFSSTQITVTWDEVPAIDQNGIIVIYEVRFDPLQLTDVLMTEYRNTTDMSVVLTGLQEYVDYNISVRAYTSVGPGPLSEDVTERTFEDRPASPPQDIRTITISSTEIEVIWEEVPAIDENGIIINYEVQVEPLDFTEVLTTIFVNTTSLPTRTVVSGLQEFVRYNISVRAYTSVGPGPFSPPVTERTLEDEPTTPPQNVQTTVLSSTEIMVTWQRVSAINESGIITNYEVEVDPLDFDDILTTITVNTTNLSTVIADLQEYVEYNIIVRAYTTVGPGPFSEPVTARTFEDEPATAPQNVQTTAESSTTIVVTWERVLAIDENGIIINYEVRFEPLEFTETLTTSSVNTTDTIDLTVVLRALQEYVEYNISVRAYTSVGPGPYSDPVTQRTLEDRPATPPQNVEANAISSTEIMVTWGEVLPIDQNGIITIYEVRYEPLQFMESLDTLVTNTTDMTVNLTNLQEYVEYNISVRAYTAIGFGPFSTQITERTFEDQPATPPQNVQTMAPSSTEITVTWEEVPAIDENGVIINYEVRFEPLEFTETLTTSSVNTTDTIDLTVVLRALQEYVEYNISVRAYTSVGPGPYSDPVTQRTLEDRPATPPQNVEANAVSSTVIMVTWGEVLPIDQNGIITIYEVRYEPLQFMESLNTLVTNTTDMIVNLTNLQEYVEYNISVRAYTAIGFGPFSTEITERTFEDEPATPPQNVQTMAPSSTEITVTWEEVPAIDENGVIINYEVRFEPLEFTETLTTSSVNTTDTIDLTVVLRALQEYVEYNISVRAYTSVGPGPYSDPVTQRTLEDRPATPPQNVEANAISSTVIMVTWGEVLPFDQNGIITIYEVRYEPLQFMESLNTLVTNTTDMIVNLTNLQEYVEYNISVRAYTAIGFGPFSTEITERTFEDEPATPPQNVQTMAPSSTEIMVTWEEVPAIDENGIIINYEVRFEPLEFTETLTTSSVNTTDTIDLTVVLRVLQEYVEYNISVRAYTSVGPGPYSDPVTQRTLEDRPATPPQNVEANAVSSTVIMVTWGEVLPIDQNGIITIYEVRYEPLQFMESLSTLVTNTTDMTVNLTNLQEYVEYNISVRAYTAIGFGPFSTEITERTFEDEPATPPQNVQTMAPSSTEIMVTWEEVPAIDENGVIINYEVRFEPLEFTETLTTSSVNTTDTIDLTVVLRALQEYVEYNISVRAYTSVGPGPYSDPVTQRTLEDRPATPPQNVEANAISSTEIMVTWGEVLPIDQNGIITIYEVRYEPLQFMESLSTLVTNTTDMTVNLTNLQEYVEYNISVRAYTSIGFGPFSTEITERTFEDVPATPPQNVQTTVLSSTEIMVTWEEVVAIDENGVIINYEVQFVPLQFANILELDSINTTDLMIVISGLQEYVEYDISVRAYTSVGPGPFSVAVTNRTFEDEPATSPQNVVTSALSSTEIMVTWVEVVAIDENGIIVNYEVRYQPLQFTSTLATTSINTTNLSANIIALEEYVEYNISVRAYTSVGPGPYSDPVTQRTLEDAPAGSPQNVIATTLTSTEIRVNWDPVPAIEENGIITTYEILYDPQETFDGQIPNNVPINTTDGLILEMTLTGLQEYVVYNITVRAYTSIGSGPYNPIGDSDRTFEDVPFVAPDNLVVVNMSANELAVSWERPTEIDINGVLRNYIIEYHIVDQSNNLLTVNVTGDTLSTVLNNLNNYTEYNVSVAAFTIGNGPFSSEIERTSENVPGEPPQNVQASNESSTTISVDWESPPQEFLFGILRGYIIRYVPGEMDIVNSTELIPPNNNSFTLENLLEFTNYSIEVTAVTGAGEGPYSTPVYVVTNQDLPGGVDMPPTVEMDDFSDEFINGVTTVTVRWNPPRDPNGVITQYNVEFVAISTNFPRPLREKRQNAPAVQEACIMGGAGNVNRSISVPGTQTSATLEGLTADSTYEFRVQGETMIGLGPFSEPQSFTTPEFVPTEPRDVTVQYLNSSSLEITWNHPLCDYGARTNYTVMHEPLAGSVDPIGEVGMPGNPAVLDTDTTSLIITELTPNTNYSITVYANTSAGRGDSSIEVNQTDEDIPQVVTNLDIASEDNPNPAFRNNVIVQLNWTAPSLRNGSFNYNLTYTALQTDDFPEVRRNTSQDSVIIAGSMEEFTIEDALPFANYSFTIFAFNIKLNAPGDSETEASRSVAIVPTAVTNLQAVPNSFNSIRVTWSIPDFPNGPVDRYAVYYRDNDTVQVPPIRNEGYQSLIVPAVPNESDFERVIENLVAFNFYAIHVQPLIGGSDLQADFVGDVDLEILQRTNSTTPASPTVGATDEPTTAPTLTTIFVYLPPTSQLVTGPLMLYEIIVVDTRLVQRDFLDNPPSTTQFGDAPLFDETERQEYYVAAAWDDSNAVPPFFVIGDESRTVANGITYVNGRLRQGTQYAVFYRIETVSDNAESLVVNTAYVFSRTASESNAAAIGVGVFFGLFIPILIVVAVIVLYVVYRRKYAEKYTIFGRQRLTSGEVALDRSGQKGLSVIANPLVKMAHTGTHDPVPVPHFADHVKHLHANDDYLFSEEYSSVEPDHAPTTEATLRPENQFKNRYANIASYDHSRVRLQEIPGGAGSDYINGNHIDGYNQPNAFIATQGPVPGSVSDFWRMVWEQGTATIVMLTNLEEKGRLKCHKYWPDAEKGATHGTIRIHLQEALVLAEYTVRTFSLQREGSKEERIVNQYHFTVWPDHGVPEYPTPLLHFVRKVAASNPINAGPIVVHCSAGVGRTGTFITLDAQMKRLKAEDNLDIFNFVRAMRYRRCFMVQTEPQYVFIHDAMLEVVECDVTEVPARDVQEQYKKLGAVNPRKGKTGLEIEFEKLDSTIHRRPPRTTGTLEVNKSKNRYTTEDMLPYDKSRCRLSTIPGEEGSDYINASNIDGYHKRSAYIATQGPLPDTADDFWRMVWERKCATIVMLTQERERGRVKCHRYWPESGAQSFGNFQVILHAVNEYPDYILREFKIVDTKDGSSLPVKQFQYTGWPEEGVPDTGSGLIDLIGQVQKWQRGSGDRPIIVHCSGGCGRTGTFIAVDILLERLKTEGVVDVFSIVRRIRLQRPGMVQSVTQYEFCYKTVLEFLDSFELYSNFK